MQENISLVLSNHKELDHLSERLSSDGKEILDLLISELKYIKPELISISSSVEVVTEDNYFSFLLISTNNNIEIKIDFNDGYLDFFIDKKEYWLQSQIKNINKDKEAITQIFRSYVIVTSHSDQAGEIIKYKYEFLYNDTVIFQIESMSFKLPFLKTNKLMHKYDPWIQLHN